MQGAARLAAMPALGDALPGLQEMWSEMEHAPPIVQPSDYWQSLNDRNRRQLDDEGFAHFKRTINMNYFGWVPHTLGDDQLRAVAISWMRHPVAGVLSARLGDSSMFRAGPWGLNSSAPNRARFLHRLFLALLWERVHLRDRRGILDRLEEPALGDPFVAEYRGRRMSQDLCNSVYELYSATAAIPGGQLGPRGVLELGGGYGRVASVFLEEFPDARYVVCDIPPALAVAQRYLTELYPDRPTFRFRRFDDGARVAQELAQAQIAFLTPNQLSLLDPLDVELFVNISSLHEMRPEQIAYYLVEADRHTRGFAYLKQWRSWHNPEDDVVIAREDYPIPPAWQELHSRIHPIQRAFFDALYRVPG
jgi:putative sugar O-methyltransferase